MTTPDEPSATVQWRKSSYSGGGGNGGGDCVEFAIVGNRVAMRDSKNPSGPTLTFSTASYRVLLDDLKEDSAL